MGGGVRGRVSEEASTACSLPKPSLIHFTSFLSTHKHSYFNVSAAGQDRVLAWGIASAAVLRLLMVAAGAELIANFKPALLVFAAILVYSAVKLALVDDEDGEEDMSENGVVQLCRYVVFGKKSFFFFFFLVGGAATFLLPTLYLSQPPQPLHHRVRRLRRQPLLHDRG